MPKHYMLEMRLDLASVDAHALAAVAGRMDGLGLSVTTLEREISADPEAVDRAYRCHMTCRRRQPPTALRREPIPFDRWHASIMAGPGALPGACFIAKCSEEYVGVCVLERFGERPDVLRSGFTGTLPVWGGRDIAKALKAHALLHAARQGCRWVETSNLQVNRGMCAINRALGFQVVRRYLHAYPAPVGPR